MTMLEGATEPGPENAYPSDPGEFAARWNARDEDGRRAFLSNLIEASARSSRCFQMNHEGLQQELYGAHQVIGTIRRLLDVPEDRPGETRKLLRAILQADNG